MEALRHEKVAAEGRAALAVSEKVESERAAAEKLQVARRRNEDLAGVRNSPVCFASVPVMKLHQRVLRATAVVWHHSA